MTAIRTLLVATATIAVAATACEPVVPVAPATTFEFAGFPVVGHIPQDPVGVVYLFHGSGGGVGFADRIETIDQLNVLTERGYGWVATESTERDGDRQWDVSDPSLVTNPDLARLAALHAELIATTPIEQTTPIFGIGMSNGARMVTLFAQSFADAGHPVAAVAPFMGRAALPVRSAGGLTVPAYWVIAQNDTTAPNPAIAADRAANAATGAASVLVTKVEEPLLAARFTRIPAIDAAEAETIRSTLAATGIWDSGGHRVMPIDEAIPVLLGLRLPPSFGAATGDVIDQIAAMLALHQFVGIFGPQVADFFDAQRGF